MKPKNLPLFYLALVLGLAGVWLFAFAIYSAAIASDPDQGADIGAGLIGMLGWLLGLASLVLLVSSYVIKSKK